MQHLLTTFSGTPTLISRIAVLSKFWTYVCLLVGQSVGWLVGGLVGWLVPMLAEMLVGAMVVSKVVW